MAANPLELDRFANKFAPTHHQSRIEAAFLTHALQRLIPEFRQPPLRSIGHRPCEAVQLVGGPPQALRHQVAGDHQPLKGGIPPQAVLRPAAPSRVPVLSS